MKSILIAVALSFVAGCATVRQEDLDAWVGATIISS
jgi:hypothetical protein